MPLRHLMKCALPILRPKPGRAGTSSSHSSNGLYISQITTVKLVPTSFTLRARHLLPVSGAFRFLPGPALLLALETANFKFCMSGRGGPGRGRGRGGAPGLFNPFSPLFAAAGGMPGPAGAPAAPVPGDASAGASNRFSWKRPDGAKAAGAPPPGPVGVATGPAKAEVETDKGGAREAKRQRIDSSAQASATSGAPKVRVLPAAEGSSQPTSSLETCTNLEKPWRPPSRVPPPFFPSQRCRRGQRYRLAAGLGPGQPDRQHPRWHRRLPVLPPRWHPRGSRTASSC